MTCLACATALGSHGAASCLTDATSGWRAQGTPYAMALICTLPAAPRASKPGLVAAPRHGPPLLGIGHPDERGAEQ